MLIATKNFSGAYYLCGYAVECALKACIAKKVQRYEFPDLNTVKQSYVHDLTALLRLAGLQRAWADECSANPGFELNWNVVKDWKEDARYSKHDENKARDFYAAVSSSPNGVIKWLKKHW